MCIEDNGDGFDAQAVIMEMEENDRLSGRGIALVRSLCESLEYREGGRVAVAVYSW